jgi:predicted O-linked N-acetylglucosamine transferase (SPINDLY family)
MSPDGAPEAARATAAAPPHRLAAAAHELRRLGRDRELVALCQAGDTASSADPALHLELGMALFRLGRQREALQALFDALRRDPRCAAAHAQLGNVLQVLQMPEEARESFRTALALGRAPVEMTAAIVFTSLEAASWGELEGDLAALEAAVGRGQGQPLPFFSLNLPWSRRQLLAAARAQAQATFAGIAPLPPAAPRAAGAPIRVGYVSGDLQEHATAHLVAELFERQDRARFVLHAYSYGAPDGSPMRRRLADAFGARFVDVSEMDARMLAQRVRADAIDVLVDLKGYTMLARNEVFAWRAAPIQVNFLGFPGSLGSAHYDYLVGDPIVTPLDHADGYDEKIAQLPRCYQPNDRQRPLGRPAARAACGLPADAFVFCCFNANYKITPALFERWCHLLREVDDAVLWLYAANPRTRGNLAAEAARRGVDPRRLFWATHLPQAEHLARIGAADLFLDTLPVNAHTTASDALWAGVPLVTTLGETFAARVAASLLHAAGLPELVAGDLDDYAAIALDLARDRARLAALRARLDEGRAHCALFDSAAYARDFDALLERMVARYDAGLAPAHLPAAATLDGRAGQRCAPED